MDGIKLVIFDLDGTLVDAYAAIVDSFNFVMQRLGYPGQAPGVIRRAVGWGDANLFVPFIKKEDIRRAVAIYRRHHRNSLLKFTKMLPGGIGVLRELKKKGFRLAIASNRPTEFSRIIIRKLGLKKYLDYVLCGDKLKQGKPNPEILKLVLRRFAVKPAEAIYVGDMAVDAQAARRARIKCVIVTGGSSSVAEIKKEKPFLVIPRINRLLGLLS